MPWPCNRRISAMVASFISKDSVCEANPSVLTHQDYFRGSHSFLTKVLTRSSRYGTLDAATRTSFLVRHTDPCMQMNQPSGVLVGSYWNLGSCEVDSASPPLDVLMSSTSPSSQAVHAQAPFPETVYQRQGFMQVWSLLRNAPTMQWTPAESFEPGC